MKIEYPLSSEEMKQLARYNEDVAAGIAPDLYSETWKLKMRALQERVRCGFAPGQIVPLEDWNRAAKAAGQDVGAVWETCSESWGKFGKEGGAAKRLRVFRISPK